MIPLAWHGITNRAASCSTAAAAATEGCLQDLQTFPQSTTSTAQSSISLTALQLPPQLSTPLLHCLPPAAPSLCSHPTWSASRSQQMHSSANCPLCPHRWLLFSSAALDCTPLPAVPTLGFGRSLEQSLPETEAAPRISRLVVAGGGFGRLESGPTAICLLQNTIS